MNALSKHPRLYLGQEAKVRCRREPKTGFLRAAQAHLEAEADACLRRHRIEYPAGSHNALLIRARHMQNEIGTLLVRWAQTEREVYLRAVLERVRRMGEWEYWSWIAWREGRRGPAAIYDLSYGENSATLAMAYDWLYEALTPAERGGIVDVARTWSFASGKVHCRRGAAGWFGRRDSNWNTVCAGGLGMLCLAMGEEVREAKTLLDRVEQSVEPFMLELDKTHGGWSEGIGYWNYGMRYAFMYLLSWENATGASHRLLRRRNTRRTLRFPLDFCPHGQPCSFSDVNRWRPSPLHYAAAERLGDTDTLSALDARLSGTAAFGIGQWPDAAEWRALHRGHRQKHAKGKKRAGGTKLYRGLDWGLLADDFLSPSLYASVRGGTTQVPHGHRDLLSFHVVVGREQFVTNMRATEYMDTTFSPRRHELPEIAPGTKNTILINGVGIAVGSALGKTEVVRAPGVEGIRMDATQAMGSTRRGQDAASFCGRVVLMLDGRALLVVDRIELPFAGRVESRMHTYQRARCFQHSALIRGSQARLRVAYAADVDAVLVEARPAPSDPLEPAPTMLRWCSTNRDDKCFTLATLLCPGSGGAALKLGREGKRLVLSASSGKWRKTVRLTRRLKL